MNSPVLNVWPLAEGAGRGFIAAGPRWTAENGRCGMTGTGATATGAGAAVSGAELSRVVLPTMLSDTDTVPFRRIAAVDGIHGAWPPVPSSCARQRKPLQPSATPRDRSAADLWPSSSRGRRRWSRRWKTMRLPAPFGATRRLWPAPPPPGGDLSLASPAAGFKGSRAARIVVAVFRPAPLAGGSVIFASLALPGGRPGLWSASGRTAPFWPALSARTPTGTGISAASIRHLAAVLRQIQIARPRRLFPPERAPGGDGRQRRSANC